MVLHPNRPTYLLIYPSPFFSGFPSLLSTLRDDAIRNPLVLHLRHRRQGMQLGQVSWFRSEIAMAGRNLMGARHCSGNPCDARIKIVIETSQGSYTLRGSWYSRLFLWVSGGTGGEVELVELGVRRHRQWRNRLCLVSTSSWTEVVQGS
jgi:hypothetical protein